MSTNAAASTSIQEDLSAKVKIGSIVDHISRVLKKIEVDTVCILGMKDDSAANHIGPLCAEVTAMWNEIQLLAAHPADFLSAWNIIESYQRLIDEILNSVKENAMTEDNAHDFGQRLRELVHCIHENPASKKSDEGVRRTSVAENGGDHNFFKDIDNVNIPQGNFVMNGHQTVIVNNNSAQLDEYMIHSLRVQEEILLVQQRTQNCVYVIIIAFF